MVEEVGLEHLLRPDASEVVFVEGGRGNQVATRLGELVVRRQGRHDGGGGDVPLVHLIQPNLPNLTGRVGFTELRHHPVDVRQQVVLHLCPLVSDRSVVCGGPLVCPPVEEPFDIRERDLPAALQPDQLGEDGLV